MNYLDELEKEVEKMESLEDELGSDLAVFDVSHTENPELKQLGEDMTVLQTAWRVVSEWQNTWDEYKGANFWTLDTEAMEDKVSINSIRPIVFKLKSKLNAGQAQQRQRKLCEARVVMESRKLNPAQGLLKNPC